MLFTFGAQHPTSAALGRPRFAKLNFEGFRQVGFP